MWGLYFFHQFVESQRRSRAAHFFWLWIAMPCAVFGFFTEILGWHKAVGLVLTLSLVVPMFVLWLRESR